jgi:flagellar hook-associated protein 1 FlgK
MQLSDAVADSADAIAAGQGDPATGAYQSGADEIALELAQLRHTPQGALGGHKSFGDVYAEIVTEVGFEVATAKDRATIHDTLKAHAENRRSSVTGVSIDEEMVSIIQTQMAYSAAARVISAADEMMRTVLGL